MPSSMATNNQRLQTISIPSISPLSSQSSLRFPKITILAIEETTGHTFPIADSTSMEESARMASQLRNYFGLSI